MKKYIVKGLNDEKDAEKVKKALGELKFSEDISVDLETGILQVSGDIGDKIVTKTVKDSGFSAKRLRLGIYKSENQLDLEESLKIRFFSSLIFLTLLMLLVVITSISTLVRPEVNLGNFFTYLSLSELVLFTPIVVVNWEIFYSGYNAILNRKPNIDSLLTISTISTYMYGLYILYITNFASQNSIPHYFYYGFTGFTLTMVTLGRYIEANKLAEANQSNQEKTTSSEISDKMAELLVPTSTILAVLSGSFWYLLMSSTAEFALTVLLTILIFASPCVITLAGPVSIIMGTIKGARNGVDFKRFGSVESSNNTKVVVIDKTGTITRDSLEMTDFELFNWNPFEGDGVSLLEETKFKVLSDIASLEKASGSKLGNAIVNGFKRDYPEAGEPSSITSVFKTIPRKGIMGIVGNNKYIVGNYDIMKMNNVMVSSKQRDLNSELAISGKTSMFIAKNGELIGIIAISDIIRENAKAAISSLQKNNHQVVMVTGEDIRTAQSIALKVGIMPMNVLPKASEADKVNYVKTLRASGKTVALVGGGDSKLMLTSADTKLAMQSSSPEVLESADVIINDDNLMGVYKALSLSTKTINNARQNTVLAFLFNILTIPISMGVLYSTTGLLMNPWIAWLTILLPMASITLNTMRFNNAKINK